MLFGFETVSFKGGNDGAGLTGFIRDGNVGANGNDVELRQRGKLPTLEGSDVTVNICANARATMSEGSQVVGDTVRFARPCTFWDLFANSVVGEGGGTVHSGPTPVFLPIVLPPPLPDMACDPSKNITINSGNTPLTLQPGTYGNINVQNGATLHLLPGLYQICSFHTGQHVTVTTMPGIELRITSSFIISDDTQFGDITRPCDAAPNVFVRGDGVGANDNTINFAKDSFVAGHFLTRDGNIALGNGNTLYGTFWGLSIHSDFNDNIRGVRP